MLEVLDTAGQEEAIARRDQQIRDGESFLLVYSISSRTSFSYIELYHKQIQRVKGSMAPPPYHGSPMATTSPLAPVPIMIVGNKSDQVVEREVSIPEGYVLARNLNCEFVETSAKNGINVEKAFYDIVRTLRSQQQTTTRSIPSTNDHQRTGNSENPDRDQYCGTKKGKRPKCVVL